MWGPGTDDVVCVEIVKPSGRTSVENKLNWRKTTLLAFGKDSQFWRAQDAAIGRWDHTEAPPPRPLSLQWIYWRFSPGQKAPLASKTELEKPPYGPPWLTSGGYGKLCLWEKLGRGRAVEPVMHLQHGGGRSPLDGRKETPGGGGGG